MALVRFACAVTMGAFPEHASPQKRLEIVKAEGPSIGRLPKAAGVEAR